MTSCPIGPRTLGCLAVLIALLWPAPTGLVRAQTPDVGTDAQRESGRALYLRNCAQCHGENGDGVGYATPYLNPRPRDFTSGYFKVRSTPSGELPTHQDLVNIIRRGMPYTSMPAWPTLSNQQVSDLAYYLTTFSPEFANANRVPEPLTLPSAPAATAESIELGSTLYVDNGCIKCHGTLGRGNGPSAETLVDELGFPIRAADLSQPWTFRGGPSREDIFRTMTTGLNGTPMPSFEEALPAEQRWAITDFIVSLSESGEPEYSNLVVARPALDAIDLARGATNFESAPTAHFPIVGQIMEPGRQFQPPTTSVAVQAVYDSESIAFLVRWHDRSPQQTGSNGLSLPVPPEEEVLTPDEPPAAADPFAADPLALDPFAEPPAPADPFALDPVAGPDAAPGAQSSEFSDAVAIQIPAQAPTGALKPYFIFGDARNAVDLWFFDLALSEPLQFTGRGGADIAPNDTGDLTGVASYDEGEWSVIFKRPLRTSSGATFSPGAFMPVAFSVWDGFSRDRGNRRGLTVWHTVYVEPEVVSSAVGPMVNAGLLVLAIELVVILWVRRRYGPGAREDRGGARLRAGSATAGPR